MAVTRQDIARQESALATNSSNPRLVVPEAPIIEKRTYASAMSYVGSLRRATAWVRRVGTTPVTASLAWSVAGTFVALMWILVLPIWYFVTLFVFGWLMIPFRLVRRSHRKQEHLQQAQLATMQAMLVQQQAMLFNDER